MPYTLELIRKVDQATSNWSGGTTTQIAIYPQQAVYADRNFTWRLSSAHVELEESSFTSLPGIWRLIMVLEGEMRLEHSGHHNIYLKPFEQDSFSGDWTTKSFGKVRDFNLMVAEGCSGELTAVNLQEKAAINMDVQASKSDRFTAMSSAFYCVTGTITIRITNNEKYELSQGDVLLINTKQHTENISVTLTNNENNQAHVIRADIKYC